MHREYIKWWSPRLDRNMELLYFGHTGTPVLVFPSSMGRFYEWEDFQMIEALREQLEHGHNQLFCVDSVDAESLYNKDADPYVRIVRHRQYESYIIEELMPFIHNRTTAEFIIVAGVSFGAYHAANVMFKHPELFGKLIAMSGSYDIRPFMNGFYDDNVYFNNPVDYLLNLHDHDQLERLRNNHLIFTAAEHDICKEANFLIHHILNEKAIPNTLDVWQDNSMHDWPVWRAMIQKHIA